MDLKNVKQLIFLDFDGVVTTTRDTPGSYITHDPSEYGVSPEPMAQLKSLLNRFPEAKVIISSNWRRFKPDGEWVYGGKCYLNPIPKLMHDLGDVCIGTLPLDRHCSKSEALNLFFAREHVRPSDFQFVIFDDDPDEGFATSQFARNYVHINFEYGLTDADVRRAVQVLTWLQH